MRARLFAKLVLGWAIAYFSILGLTSAAAKNAGGSEAASEQGVHLIKSDAQSIVLELRTLSYDLEEVTVGGRGYHSLVVPGYASNDRPGHPQLPLQGALLGIPPNAEAELHILEAEGEIIPGNYDLLPVPRPEAEYDLSSGLPVAESTELVQDQSVYSVNAFYPADLACTNSSGYIRDQRFVQLQLFPFQYNPMSQQLKVYQLLRVEVVFSYPVGEALGASGGELGGPFETTLRNSMLNYESARAWRQRSTHPGLLEATALDSCDSCYKIPVDEAGMYQLTYADLEAAGIPIYPPGFIEPRNFHIYNSGQEIAIQVQGEEDGVFELGDYVLFYGQGVDTKYTNTNIYWFTADGETGKRMQTKSGQGAGTTPPWFEATVHAEEDHGYLPWLPFGEGEHWYWAYLQATSNPVTATYTISLNNIYAGEAYSGTLRSLVQGASANDFVALDHHVLFYLNDYLVHDAWWDGKTPYQFEADFPGSVLQNGQNTISVVAKPVPGISFQTIVTDWFEITHRDTHIAEDDSLAFSQDDAGTWQYQVGNFSQPSVETFDITDPTNVSRIISTTIAQVESTYTLTFTQQVTSPARYLTITESRRKSAGITADTPSHLRDPLNGADYVVITHRDFLDSALRLASHRATQGLSTSVVDVEDVYDEFSYGLLDPQAIRDFLTYAYDYWTPRPSYVLLVGDGNHDPKDNIGYGEPNYIPPFLVCADPFPGGCEIPADNRYACVSGSDNMPDMFIGRLPVKTPEEADAVIDKILTYEASPFGGWRQHVLFVADNPDEGGDFPATSDYIADGYLPAGYTAQEVYYGVFPYTEPIRVTRAITESINDGRLLVNYFGHGYIQFWGAEKFLEEDTLRHDLSTLTNSERYPLMMSMSCYLARFTYPSGPVDLSCLSESLVRAQAKGSVATWAATGLGEIDGHKLLDAGFFTAVFSDGVVEVGAATAQAAWGMTSHQYLVDQYVLFGDPAMRLAIQYDSFLPLACKQY